MANGAKQGVLAKMELTKITSEISELMKEIENDLTIGPEISESITGHLRKISDINKNPSLKED